MSNLATIERNTENTFYKIFHTNNIESAEQRSIQLELAEYYNNVMASPIEHHLINDSIEYLSFVRGLENAWNRYEENKIKDIALPINKNDFIEWYNNILQNHKKAVLPFFQYLADDASFKEIAHYIYLESKVDGRFDDIIALAQVGVSGRAKVVMANNYWDEMGHGDLRKMHTVMFNQSVKFMKNVFKNVEIPVPVASYKNGNILSMYLIRRKYIPRALGVLGILEDTASDRFSMTVKGLRRLRIPSKALEYHLEHIEVDDKHGKEWFQYVLLPYIKKAGFPFLQEVSRGILIRYNIAVDYYNSIAKVIDLQRGK